MQLKRQICFVICFVYFVVCTLSVCCKLILYLLDNTVVDYVHKASAQEQLKLLFLFFIFYFYWIVLGRSKVVYVVHACHSYIITKKLACDVMEDR